MSKRLPPRATWPLLGALAFLLAVPLLLFLGSLLSGRLIYGYDMITLGLPLHAEVRRSLAAHQWPLWLPDLLGGMPGIAASNVSSLFPSDFIGALAGCSLRTQLCLDAILNVALAGLGMFAFLRRLDRSVSAALLGALFFAVSGSVLSQVYGGFYNMMAGIALLPWAFWAAHKARQESSRFAWGLCGLVFALQILAGAAQLFVYTLAAVLAFFCVLPPAGSGTFQSKSPGRWRAWEGVILAAVLAFFLAAPRLWTRGFHRRLHEPV
ncbi:MAG: hypothetical protein ACREKE_00360 [bacterium]